MNEFDKTNQQHVNNGSGRRKFLKKSATGAVVFSLPAKSVWGACTPSGAMSGNLSHHRDASQTCTVSIMDDGANAALWSDANRVNVLTDPSSYPLLFKVVMTYKNSAGATDADYKILVDKYADEYDAALLLDLNLPIIAVSPTVGEALAMGDNMARVAAIFLNAYFQIYPGFNDRDAAAAAALAQESYLFMVQNENSSNPMTLMDTDFLLVGSGFMMSGLNL